MRSQDVEKMIIGSVREVVKDRALFYHSSVGPEYCHLTAEGIQAVGEMFNVLLPRLLRAQELEDIERSKAMVLEELKKS